jgi:hypothetical protein
MGNDVSKLAPTEDERAAIEAAAVKKADDKMAKYAAEYRAQHPQRNRKQRGSAEVPSLGQSSISNEDAEPRKVEIDAESDTITVPIRSGSSLQASPLANDLLASFNPRKQKEPEKQPVQDGDSIEFRNVQRSESSTHKPAKEGPMVDIPAVSSKISTRVTSATSAKSPTVNTSPVTSSTASKRPAPVDSAGPARQISASTISNMPKIQKRSSVASPQSPDRVSGGHTSADTNQRPPAWYTGLSVPSKRLGNDGGVDTLLRSLRDEIRQSRSLLNPQSIYQLEGVFREVRHKLHTIVFHEVTAVLLKRNRMLHDADGLPQIFDQVHSNGVQWPFDIQADAKELYNKWCRKDFGTDIMRGILFAVKGAKRDGGDRIDPSYTRVVNAKRHGNNGLVNGQWWPFQICALRDGAHGSIQGGISGSKGDGAFSCILSGGVDSKGQPYPDKDEGNVVWFVYVSYV